MKVLILNGSPHKKGNTAYILEEIKKKIPEVVEIEEMLLYKENIKFCNDCRFCWKNEGCTINDKMDIIWRDDYDVIIVASPVYMYNLTPPLFSMVTRLNMKWCNKYFLNKEYKTKEKKGILVLTGGGQGNPSNAIDMANIIFKILNAKFDIDIDYIYSLNTDSVLAKDDNKILGLIDRTIKHIFIE